MIKNTFSEDDKQKVVDFLNFIAERATFPNWSTKDTVVHFKLLAHMQQVILPKIDAHVFEMGQLVQTNKDVKIEEE